MPHDFPQGSPTELAPVQTRRTEERIQPLIFGGAGVLALPGGRGVGEGDEAELM